LVSPGSLSPEKPHRSLVRFSPGSADPIHNTHNGTRSVRIYYRWHPYCGRELPMLNRYRRWDAYCVRLPDETSMILPAWMCDAARCAALRELPSPCVAGAALQRLRCLLDERAAQSKAYASDSSHSEPAAGSDAADSRARRARERRCPAVSHTLAGHQPARATAPHHQHKPKPARNS